MDVGDFRGYMPFESNIDEFNVETFDCGSPEEYSDLQCFTKKMAEIQLDDIWNVQEDDHAWSKAPDPTELPCNPFSILSFVDSRICGLNPLSSNNGLWNAASDSEGSNPPQCVVGSSRHMSDVSVPRLILPPTPPMSIAKTVRQLELEQELMEQHASTSIPVAINAPIVTSPPCSSAKVYDTGPCLTLPPECAQFVPFWYDYLIGRIQFLPQEVPAVPQFIVDRHRQDAHMLLSWLCSVGNVPLTPDRIPEVVEKEDTVEQVVVSRRGTVYANKVPGMPSGKTIEDLAFDQFAGFMSYKERQWLIRIQMLQCQGTGDSSIDDYYYINWKRKQLNKTGAHFDDPLVTGSSDCYQKVRRPRIGEYKKNQKTSTNLGRPYQCTSKFPRHLITVEDNEEKTNKN